MNKWHISKINNATHEVELRHVDGRVRVIVVPEEHRDHHDKKTAFIKGEMLTRTGFAKRKIKSFFRKLFR